MKDAGLIDADIVELMISDYDEIMEGDPNSVPADSRYLRSHTKRILTGFPGHDRG